MQGVRRVLREVYSSALCSLLWFLGYLCSAIGRMDLA